MDADERGAGKRYLIQHSAGSGKSNSIAWLAHQLIGLSHADQPIFDSIKGLIARAMLSIPATRGVEFGDGFTAAGMRGSEHNDPYASDGDRVRTLSNHAGGAVGGSPGRPESKKADIGGR